MNDLRTAFGEGEYLSFTLKNGIKVVAVRDDGAPIIRGTILVHAGAIDSPDTGVAHYFEHIMFKGTDKIGTIDYPSERIHLKKIEELYTRLTREKNPRKRISIQKEINAESLKASTFAIPNDYANLVGKYGGSSLNAATSYDYTRYDHNVAPEYFEHWCHLNTERLRNPVFRLFQSELETVYEEKNMYANRLGNKEQELISYKVAYPHPYAYPIIGNTEALLNPDLGEMKSFYKKYYVPSNMEIILTGPLPKKGLNSLLEETFGSLKPSRNNRVRHPKNPSPRPFSTTERLYVRSTTMHAKTSILVWHTVPLLHPDLLPIQVLQEMLNNGNKTGKLDELVISGALTSAVAFSSAMKEMGAFYIYITPLPDKPSYTSAEDAVRAALRSLEEDNEENRSLFRRVVLSLLKQQFTALEGLSSRHATLVNLAKEGSDLDALDREISRLKELTYDEVVQVIRKYFTDNYLNVRERKGAYPVEEIPKPGFGALPAPNAGATSPYASFLQSLEVKEHPYPHQDLSSEALPAKVWRTGKAALYHTPVGTNGIFTLDLIHFRRKKNHPSSEILPAYLEMIGGGGMTSKELFSRLQELGASLSFTSREDSFLISLSGFDRYFRETISLMEGFLSSPDRNPEALKQEQSNFSLMYQTKMRSDVSLFSLAFSTVLEGKAERDAYLFSPEEISALTVDDLLRELSEVRSSELDVHYTGSLPVDSVYEILTEELDFSRVQIEGMGYGYHSPLPTREARIFTFDDPNDGSQSLIGSYQGFGVLSPSDELMLDFFALYLGGYMGSVLFQEIREFRSMAYAVQAYSVTPHPAVTSSDGRDSALCCRLFTRVDKTEDAIKTFEGIVRDLPLTLERVADACLSYRANAISAYPDSLRMHSRRAVLLHRSGYDADPIISKVRLAETDPHTLLDQLRAFYDRVVKSTPIVHVHYGRSDRMNEEVYGMPISRLLENDITK